MARRQRLMGQEYPLDQFTEFIRKRSECDFRRPDSEARSSYLLQQQNTGAKHKT